MGVLNSWTDYLFWDFSYSFAVMEQNCENALFGSRDKE